MEVVVDFITCTHKTRIHTVLVMSCVIPRVEYGTHCLLWLVGSETPPSSQDFAEFQGISTVVPDDQRTEQMMTFEARLSRGSSPDSS
jgi:hypothetical protein